MNGEMFDPLCNRGDALSFSSGHRLPSIAVLIAALIIVFGCVPKGTLEPEVEASEVVGPEVHSLPSALVETPVSKIGQSQAARSSNETPWADGYEGILIAGLDGGFYEPYEPATIERAQVALMERGLYSGPIDGTLGSSTMQAIYDFQQATHTLQRCGIPTPRTRKMLEQGSHTDPSL